MGINKNVSYDVQCDGCQTPFFQQFDETSNKTKIEKYLKEHGWTVSNGKVLCKPCSALK